MNFFIVLTIIILIVHIPLFFITGVQLSRKGKIDLGKQWGYIYLITGAIVLICLSFLISNYSEQKKPPIQYKVINHPVYEEIKL